MKYNGSIAMLAGVYRFQNGKFVCLINLKPANSNKCFGRKLLQLSGDITSLREW